MPLKVYLQCLCISPCDILISEFEASYRVSSRTAKVTLNIPCQEISGCVLICDMGSRETASMGKGNSETPEEKR